MKLIGFDFITAKMAFMFISLCYIFVSLFLCQGCPNPSRDTYQATWQFPIPSCLKEAPPSPSLDSQLSLSCAIQKWD